MSPVDDGTGLTPALMPSGQPECRAFAEHMQNDDVVNGLMAWGFPEDLAQVIKTWNKLPKAVRRGFVAMAKAFTNL